MLTKGMFVADRYEVIEKVGSGGMSDVYKAQDHILGRVVAIKVLKAEFSEDMNFVTKFRTEAQSAAGLEHPNIINIYDVGSQDGLHFIVMEYVEGVTLKTYIGKKGQLTYKEAVSIAIQVGRGIEAAHAKNIIHRDIKPQNILISTDGKAKVTDFGIARAVSNNTISADVMGSVHYASPEQARNGFVDEKSDIYSLGIVMYEMVTGRVPYDGDTTVAVALGHLQEEMVPPSEYAPNLPISLEKIILKCTQKTLERRYQNMGDLLADLKKVLISPNEDFVVMVSPSENGKTRVISDDEIGELKRAKTVVPIDTSRTAEQVERTARAERVSRPERPERPERVVEKKRRYEEPEDDYYDDDDDDFDDEGALNPNLEKIVTVAGIVTAIIIILVILYLLGNIIGIFGGSKKKETKEDPQATEEVVDEPVDETPVAEEPEKEPEPEVDENIVEMPYIVGMSFEAAKDALNEKGLGIQQADSEYSDTYAEGQIISQDVAAGDKVEKNTTVRVTISKGVAPITIPNVVGMDESTAKGTLVNAGFACSDSNVTYAYSDTVEKGKVISQSPSSGATGTKGSTVTITVSKGKELVEVPNVVGQAQYKAQEKLAGLGFVAKKGEDEYSDTVPVGSVVSQSVAPGTMASKGTEIVICMSKGPKGDTYVCQMTITADMVDGDGLTPSSIEMYVDGAVKVSAAVNKWPITVNESGITTSDPGNVYLIVYFAEGGYGQVAATLTKQ